MNDDKPTPNNNDAGQPPAPSPVDNKAGSPNPTESQIAEMAKKIGRLEAMEAEYKTYREKTEPVLETVWGDQEVFNTVNKAYLKKIGKDPDAETPGEDKKPIPDPKINHLESKTVETRNFAISTIVDNFNKEKGINNMTNEEKKEINTKIASALGEMLDPKGNKTLPQIMEDVDITKLPKFLENAYYLATKDDQIRAAETSGRKKAEEELTGVIGSIPSGSVQTDTMTLTAREKEVARKMGVSEEAYLKSKKDIASRDNALIWSAIDKIFIAVLI